MPSVKDYKLVMAPPQGRIQNFILLGGAKGKGVLIVMVWASGSGSFPLLLFFEGGLRSIAEIMG